ncbi:MAG TPA: hypothetical protein P5079_05340, partial [Elusimicrobiota bacterium]|nr:hypothetical protein [Elusimicrobiota bacterium]
MPSGFKKYLIPIALLLLAARVPLSGEEVIIIDPDPIIIIEPDPQPNPDPPPPPPDPEPDPPPITDPVVVLETGTVTFAFESHGNFYSEIKRFLDWMGVSYEPWPLWSALREFGGECLKDRGHHSGGGWHGHGHHNNNDPPLPETETHTLDLLPLVNSAWQGGIIKFELILTCRLDEHTPDNIVLNLTYKQPVLRVSDGSVVQMPVDVRMDPSHVNTYTHREFITMSLELPEGYNPREINRLTVRITQIDGQAVEPPIRSSPQNFSFTDRDWDHKPELRLKFRYSRLKPYLAHVGTGQFTVKGFMNTGEEFSTEYSQLFIRSNGHHVVCDRKGRAQVVVAVTTQTAPLPLTVQEDQSGDIERERIALRNLLKTAGEGYHFGPEGTVFQQPVEITIPYDPEKLNGVPETDLKVFYWNKVEKIWEPLISRVDTVAHTVTAEV